MDMNNSKQLRDSAFTVILREESATGEPPIAPFIIDEHREDFLTLQDAGDPNRGHLAGFFGWLAIAMICLELLLMLYGISESVLIELAITTLLFLVTLLLEVRRPLPLPIVFNRRTREVYVDQDGVLFHASWDGLCAEVNEFQLVDIHVRGMQNASLEIRVWKFQQPDTELMVSLGAPFGKTLSLQKGVWEYLRAYMNNGPWFDERGHRSDSDTFVKSQLTELPKIRKSFMPTRSPVKRVEKKAVEENYISGSEAVKIILRPVFYPMSRIQKAVYSLAKHRSQNRWPRVVRERLTTNGPITRLIDLEHEKTINS
jgi:hypothetical protein